MSKAIPQHKQMAMGQKTQGYAKGGFVKPSRDTGMKDSPIEKVKRANGIPGCGCGGMVKK